MHVEVVYALPEEQHRVHLELAEGATVEKALTAVSRVRPFCDLDLANHPVALFGRPAHRSDVLRHGDRVELLRALLIDPKEARRRRAAGR
jgi:putative ubiquitin-RnfH superfamily antitoxin RatB of RatAB toxin-antitoxin module